MDRGQQNRPRQGQPQLWLPPTSQSSPPASTNGLLPRYSHARFLGSAPVSSFMMFPTTRFWETPKDLSGGPESCRFCLYQSSFQPSLKGDHSLTCPAKHGSVVLRTPSATLLLHCPRNSEDLPFFGTRALPLKQTAVFFLLKKSEWLMPRGPFGAGHAPSPLNRDSLLGGSP